MKRYVIALTVALMMIALMTTPRSQAQEKPKGNAEAGKALYMTSCKKCHSTSCPSTPVSVRVPSTIPVLVGSARTTG